MIMKKLAENTYEYEGQIIALAAGSYNPEDDSSIKAKLDEIVAEVEAQLLQQH
jgi:hypothetical protein